MSREGVIIPSLRPVPVGYPLGYNVSVIIKA